jgi:DNA modification methylase
MPMPVDDDVTLLLGDCLDVLSTLSDGSVDAIVTDPPYGQTNEGYDGPIAFGADLWRECFRVARPNAALISFAGSPTYHRIATAAEAGGWKVRQMWGWIYRDGFITSSYPREGFDRLGPAMDPICFATKGKVILNLSREGDYQWTDKGGGGRYDGQNYSVRAGTHGKSWGAGRWPRAIVASDGVEGFQYFVLSRTMGGSNPEKTGHPNQKPLALMRWLVAKLPPGSVVLDPFAGSGTTGAACLDEGHAFIGIESNADYYAIAERRLAAHRSATPLLTGVS